MSAAADRGWLMAAGGVQRTWHHLLCHAAAEYCILSCICVRPPGFTPSCLQACAACAPWPTAGWRRRALCWNRTLSQVRVYTECVFSLFNSSSAWFCTAGCPVLKQDCVASEGSARQD